MKNCGYILLNNASLCSEFSISEAISVSIMVANLLSSVDMVCYNIIFHQDAFFNFANRLIASFRFGSLSSPFFHNSIKDS